MPYREVILTKGWHTDAMGAMITTLKEDGTVVTILPSESGGYEYTDPHTGKKQKVMASTEKILGQEALCFYRPLPMHYFAFNAAYAYISTAFSSLASVAVTAVSIKPSIDLIKPLLESESEMQDG